VLRCSICLFICTAAAAGRALSTASITDDKISFGLARLPNNFM
jgi:hypothetical protein